MRFGWLGYSLAHSLSHSPTPSLTRSFGHFLPPSLHPSLPSSLPHTLAPSMPIGRCCACGWGFSRFPLQVGTVAFAQCNHELGSAYGDARCLVPAEKCLKQAIAVREHRLGKLHPATCVSRARLAELYHAHGPATSTSLIFGPFLTHSQPRVSQHTRRMMLH